MRLDRYLAESSIGTRKQVRNFIQDGDVTVNDRMITESAVEIDEHVDLIKYRDDVIQHPGKMYYMFYKPSGCVTARKDVSERTVLDYFPKEVRDYLFPVGRLDKDTEGLLLFTNDGEFNHRLMAPENHVEKTYFFWALGSIDNSDINQLKKGVYLHSQEERAIASRVEVLKHGIFYELQDEIASCLQITDMEHNAGQPVVSGYLTITEGRKHQVKRMLKAIGCYVIYLKRISIGEVYLDNDLEKGEYRLLTTKEIQLLEYPDNVS